jgi:hypothetical protein
MGRHIFFIGGNKCVEHGIFYDPPMHRECAVYALQACPHLARSKGRYAAPEKITPLPGMKLAIGAMNTEHCEWFGLMHDRSYKWHRARETRMIVITAKLPWIEVERWREGALMPTEAAI